MGRIEDRLDELGLTLPKPFAPPPGVEFKFDLVTVSGDLAYVSGHLPTDGAEVLREGKVGAEVTVEEGYEAARLTGLAILASLKRELGSSTGSHAGSRPSGSSTALRASAGRPAVVNGFSDLVLEVWGRPAATPARRSAPPSCRSTCRLRSRLW